MSTALLEIPEFRRRVSPITVGQYHHFPEFNENGRRTELVRGVVIEKMSKSPLHCSVASRLYRRLLAAVPAGWTVRKEEPMTLSDSEPEPDLAVVRGDECDFVEAHPTTAALVVEIAVASAAEDRARAALYAEAAIGEYWIVLPRQRQIEVHRRPFHGAYAERFLMEGEAVLACESVPGVRIALPELFD